MTDQRIPLSDLVIGEEFTVSGTVTAKRKGQVEVVLDGNPVGVAVWVSGRAIVVSEYTISPNYQHSQSGKESDG